MRVFVIATTRTIGAKDLTVARKRLRRNVKQVDVHADQRRKMPDFFIQHTIPHPSAFIITYFENDL
jgi:hypothetical protein